MSNINDNWVLRIYNDRDKVIHEETFFASTNITADKIALNCVERDWRGYDWTLSEID